MALNKFRINILTIAIIFLANVMTVIFTDVHTMDKYANILIPVIMFSFIFFTKKRNIYLAYTVIGCLVMFFGTMDNPIAVVFFFLSAYDHRTERNIYINIILAIIIFSVKSYMMGYATYDIFAVMGAFFFIAAHMYIRFWPIADVRKHKEIEPKGFTIEQADTIKILLEDIRHQEAADKLHIGRKAFTARVSALRARYNVTTDFMLALHLIEDGIININELAKANPTEKKS